MNFDKIVAKYSEPPKNTYFVSTGSILLNEALGIDGYPSGRMIEIFGQEGAGKTTLGLMALAEGQALGFPVAIIDAEAGFDINYAHALGLSGKANEDFGLFLPEYGEQAVEMVRDLISMGIKMILIDSVSALVPKAEYTGDTGEAFMGLQARMMGQACRQLTGIVARSGCILIWINQSRSKIGQFFGSPETTSGGRALRFYASIRIGVRAVKADEVGHNLIAKIAKNKLAPPLKVAELPLLYGLGVDLYEEFYRIGVEAGVIEKQGSSWCAFEGEKYLGKTKLIKHLRDNYTKEQIMVMYENL